MAESEWVVLAEHLQQTAWIPIDGAGVELLALDDALRDQGIESNFQPYRPGESGGFTDAVQQPVQLLVRRVDVTQARQIARDVLGSESDLLVN